MRHLPTAVASALLLVSGSGRAIAAGLDALSGALLAAGLIAFGVWIKGEDD